MHVVETKHVGGHENILGQFRGVEDVDLTEDFSVARCFCEERYHSLTGKFYPPPVNDVDDLVADKF